MKILSRNKKLLQVPVVTCAWQRLALIVTIIQLWVHQHMRRTRRRRRRLIVGRVRVSWRYRGRRRQGMVSRHSWCAWRTDHVLWGPTRAVILIIILIMVMGGRSGCGECGGPLRIVTGTATSHHDRKRLATRHRLILLPAIFFTEQLDYNHIELLIRPLLAIVGRRWLELQSLPRNLLRSRHGLDCGRVLRTFVPFGCELDQAYRLLSASRAGPHTHKQCIVHRRIDPHRELEIVASVARPLISVGQEKSSVHSTIQRGRTCAEFAFEFRPHRIKYTCIILYLRIMQLSGPKYSGRLRCSSCGCYRRNGRSGRHGCRSCAFRRGRWEQQRGWFRCDRRNAPIREGQSVSLCVFIRKGSDHTRLALLRLLCLDYNRTRPCCLY